MYFFFITLLSFLLQPVTAQQGKDDPGQFWAIVITVVVVVGIICGIPACCGGKLK